MLFFCEVFIPNKSANLIGRNFKLFRLIGTKFETNDSKGNDLTHNFKHYCKYVYYSTFSNNFSGSYNLCGKTYREL